MSSRQHNRQGRAAQAAAIALVLGLAATVPAASKPPEHKPKPKPKLELLTETQSEALEQESIQFGVESKRGDEVRVKGTLTVNGIPEPYVFDLRPQSRRLRQQHAKLRLELSRRQREVLAFAEQACMGARVDVQGKVGSRIGELHESLRKDPGC